MAEGNIRYICLKLADKSLYSLYKSGQAGDKKLTVTPAAEGQSKNEISLFDCTGGKTRLLRDILIENSGDMVLNFSLGRDYLSYRIDNSEGEELNRGLIEFSSDDDIPDFSEEKPRQREKGRLHPPRGLIVASVILSLALLLSGGYFLVNRTARTEHPPLINSEMTPR